MSRRGWWIAASLVLVVGLVSLSPAFGAVGDKKAKDIFYNPQPSTPQVQQQMAISYKILLLRNCNLHQVPQNFVFFGGDKFRLVVQSNMDGYLYIFNKGTTGASRLLFPDPRINNGNNMVTQYAEHVLPASGWFEFDRNPGSEQLVLFFSPKKLDNVNFAPGALIPAAGWDTAVAPYFARQAKSVQANKQTKDIVFVDEGQDVSPVAGVVGPAIPPPVAPGQPLPTGPLPPNLTPQTFVATQINGPALDGLLIHTISLIHR